MGGEAAAGVERRTGAEEWAETSRTVRRAGYEDVCSNEDEAHSCSSALILSSQYFTRRERHFPHGSSWLPTGGLELLKEGGDLRGVEESAPSPRRELSDMSKKERIK